MAVKDIIQNNGSLNITQYVINNNSFDDTLTIDEALTKWNKQASELKNSMDTLFQS